MGDRVRELAVPSDEALDEVGSDLVGGLEHPVMVIAHRHQLAEQPTLLGRQLHEEVSHCASPFAADAV